MTKHNHTDKPLYAQQAIKYQVLGARAFKLSLNYGDEAGRRYYRAKTASHYKRARQLMGVEE